MKVTSRSVCIMHIRMFSLPDLKSNEGKHLQLEQLVYALFSQVTSFQVVMDYMEPFNRSYTVSLVELCKP